MCPETNKRPKHKYQTEAPHASAKARISVDWPLGRASPTPGADGGGDGTISRDGESVPSGGILSGKPVAVALMNLARATTSDGVDQMGDS